jgi:hypothetical protein
MDFDRFSWFMAGLIIGNLLNTFTTVVLLLIWLIVRNQALPPCMGSYYPQDLLANLFTLLGLWAAMAIPTRAKFTAIEAPTNITPLITPQISSISSPLTNITPSNTSPQLPLILPSIRPISAPPPLLIQSNRLNQLKPLSSTTESIFLIPIKPNQTVQVPSD